MEKICNRVMDELKRFALHLTTGQYAIFMVGNLIYSSTMIDDKYAKVFFWLFPCTYAVVHLETHIFCVQFCVRD